MATLSVKPKESRIQRFFHKLIQENLPRKYKRTVLITSLICALDKSSNISDTTFRKIIKLFEIGSVKENELKYAYYTRKYLWNDLISNDTIDFRGDHLHLPDMIDLYVNCNNAFNLSITEQLIDTIYSRIPEYIRYGSEQVTKHDLLNVLFFIKNKNRIAA